MYRLASHFHYIEPVLVDQAQSIYEDLFKKLLPDNWKPEGTMIATYHHKLRIGFAVRKSNCSLHFHGNEAVQLYQELGGSCPCGKVTIKLPYDRNWDISIIQNTIGIMLSKSTG